MRNAKRAEYFQRVANERRIAKKISQGLADLRFDLQHERRLLSTATGEEQAAAERAEKEKMAEAARRKQEAMKDMNISGGPSPRVQFPK